MSGYSVSPRAIEDLFDIWQYIAQDSEDAANRVQSDVNALANIPMVVFL